MSTDSLSNCYFETLPAHLQVLAQALLPNMGRLGAGAECLFLAAEPIKLFVPAGELTKDEEKALFLLLAALLVGRGQGSIYLPLEEIKSCFARLLSGQAGAGGGLPISAGKLSQLAIKLINEGRPPAFWSRAAGLENSGAKSAEEGEAESSPDSEAKSAENPPLLSAERGGVYIARHFKALSALEKHIERLKKPFGDSAKCTATRKEKLAELLAHPPVKKGAPMVLSAEQVAALDMALSRRLSVLAGGPGSGKTAVISAIVRLAASIGPVFPPEAIALAAPTGKAAARIMEALQKNIDDVPDENKLESDRDLLARLAPASTLHRLLGVNPRSGGFTYDNNNPLPARLVIVDEASMIDLFMLERLFRAIGTKTILLLVGDPHQLPPVGAAAIFKDLCAAWRDTPQAVILSGNYRSGENQPGAQGVAISALAPAILEGEPLPSRIFTKDAAAAFQAEGAFFLRRAAFPEAEFMELLVKRAKENKEIIYEKLKEDSGEFKIFKYGENGFNQEDETKLNAVSELISAKMILTAGHEGRFGDIKINKILHSVYDKKADCYTIGEPVMCTQNDYLHNIFNGDVGFIAPVQSGNMEAEPMALFKKENTDADGRHTYTFVPYPLASLADHLTPAHAITVHKAQGSEASEVLVLLPEKENALISKELLYTAATRAKDRLIIYGAEEIWDYGLKREDKRLSGLFATPSKEKR